MRTLLRSFSAWCVFGVLFLHVAGCARRAGRIDGLDINDRELVGEQQHKKNEYLSQLESRRIYPELYNLVQVHPKNPGHHASMLAKAQEPEDAAYHIIAIGMLAQDTPEVRAALQDVFERFQGVRAPRRYDWPDLAEKFKRSLVDGPQYVIDHYPGNRFIAMADLVVECEMRLR